MNTLTKEYFDERLDEVRDGLKERIEGVQRGLQKDIQNLAAMTTTGFADLEKRLDLRERVENLERKIASVESALNVRLERCRHPAEDGATAMRWRFVGPRPGSLPLQC